MEINVRELILDILLRIERDGELSHIAVGSVLEKYQFLPKSDRALLPGFVRERWSIGCSWIISLTASPV